MPYPIEVNDTRGIIWYHDTADEFADMIVDQCDEMLAQSARQRARRVAAGRDRSGEALTPHGIC